MAFISVTEFQNANPTLDLSKYTPATLSGVLERATARVENYLDYSLPFEVITNEKANGYVDANGDIVISPSKKPIRSVQAISIVKGTYSADLTLVDGSGNNRYDIPRGDSQIIVSGREIVDSSVSVLELAELRHQTFYTQIDYSAGYYMYDRPDDLVDAVGLYAKDEIARNQNVSGASEIRQGGITVKYAQSKAGQDSDMISDAKAILNKYKRTSGW